MTEDVRKYADCKFFLLGKCNRTNDCPFRHIESSVAAKYECKFWNQNRCWNINCQYLHLWAAERVDERKLSAKAVLMGSGTAVCKFNLHGKCNNVNCHFLHSSDVVESDVSGVNKNNLLDKLIVCEDLLPSSSKGQVDNKPDIPKESEAPQTSSILSKYQLKSFCERKQLLVVNKRKNDVRASSTSDRVAEEDVKKARVE